MEKSTSIKNIASALNTFREKCGKIKKDSKNPFFKSSYASLSNILDTIDGPLQESKLVFSQFPDDDKLTTILVHTESGEFMQSSYNIHPVKSDPQGIGSAITYARRYALGAILGLNIDEDDDGNAATHQSAPQASQNGTSQKITPNTEADLPWMSEKQFSECKKRINEGNTGVLAEAKKHFRIKRDFREQLEQLEQFTTNLIDK